MLIRKRQRKSTAKTRMGNSKCQDSLAYFVARWLNVRIPKDSADEPTIYIKLKIKLCI
jgi:hypothetical protein